ncbi:MAG: hypothetical protein U0Q55_03265 [Vicinamibacterales bacterium]
MRRPPTFLRSLARIAVVGLALAVALGAGGLALERSRIGATDEAAVARVQTELRARFDVAAAALRQQTDSVSRSGEALTLATRDAAESSALFQTLAALQPAPANGSTGLSLYNTRGIPVAWAGRVSDLPRDRIDGPSSVFVTLDPLGPRLVRVEPLLDRARPGSPRAGTVVAEQLVAERVDVSGSVTDTFRLPTSVVDVDVRVTPAQPPVDTPYGFVVRGADGRVLVEAAVSPEDLAHVRAAWRGRVRAGVILVLACTLLFLAGPVLEARRHSTRRATWARHTALLLILIVASRLLVAWALRPIFGGGASTPSELLPNALLLLAVVSLALDSAERRRVAAPRPRLLQDERWATVVTVLGFALAGAAAAWILWTYEQLLAGLATGMSQDLLRFSLHPFELSRLGAVTGLVLLHAAVVWGAAGVLRAPTLIWRMTRRPLRRALTIAAAVAGAAAW